MGEIPTTKLQSRASGRGKSLQQSLVSEWGKSHNGVSWRDIEDPVLLLRVGEIPARDNQTILKVIRIHIHENIETLNDIIDANAGKCGCISLATVS